MKAITENVYVETQWSSDTYPLAGSNSSFVTTSEGIVMIDAPLVPVNAIEWREVIAGKGKLVYLINNEHHIDHTLGDYFFQGTIISHEETRKSLVEASGKAEDYRGKIRERYPNSINLVKDYKVTPPTITFSGELNLYLGGHTFRLLHLPGHTLGQIGVYVPEERVVFTGDNFTNGLQPALAECYPLEWLDSLERILNLDVEFVVPGHGEVGDKEAVRNFKGFLEHCVGTVREAIKSGMSRKEAINTIDFEDQVKTLHPGREQQWRNVARIYEMLSK